MELGNHAEFLDVMSFNEMLAMYFVHDAGETQKWRLKGHAEVPFWRWVTSWARACRRPSDMGYEDRSFNLPPLTEHEHIIKDTTPRSGMLFSLPARTLEEQREERRNTILERCEYLANLANSTDRPVLVWCHLNREGNTLEKMIPDAIQVAGADKDEDKESKLIGFADGEYRVLVTKPKIGAWGLNFQRCSHIALFPTHSYEQYYQGIRRCWRFGQENPVRVDIIATEGEVGVLHNLQNKAAKADAMFTNLVREMNNAESIIVSDDFTRKQEVPSWL
jgi:hypothetical protein